MDGLFETQDRSKHADRKFCPMIKSQCLGPDCQWWVMDFMDDKEAYRVDCAVSIAAKGLTDESLLRLARR